MRGMVVSCPRAGQIWGSPEMAESLAALETLGVEWISIHPYAGVRRDGTIRWRPASGAGYLERAVELVRARRMSLFWKPHLAYWGSFRWRGDIDFGDDEAAWHRFFTGYRDFIVDQAAFAERAGVELLAIGVELDATTRHEAEWRHIIAEVRRVYRGAITYAANWDRLDAVPFWDAVDLIGVHAYFPLAESGELDRAALWRGWDVPLERLRRLSSEVGDKRIVFAEIGYNRSSSAAREPWSYRMDDDPGTRSLRQRLIEVALERIGGEPLVAGMFWWKWIPGPIGHDRDFSMKDPEALEALRRHWAPPAATIAR